MDYDDLGAFFVERHAPTPRIDVWQMVAISETPTVTMENVRTGEKVHFCVGSPMAKGFIRLVAESDEEQL